MRKHRVAHQKEATGTDAVVAAVSNKPSGRCDFFDVSHVISTVRVVFRNGPRRRRLRVLLLIVTLVVIEGPIFGEMAVMYLFTRYRFNWNEVDFSVFSTFTTLTNLVGKHNYKCRQICGSGYRSI